jgi:hypothetical protein
MFAPMLPVTPLFTADAGFTIGSVLSIVPVTPDPDTARRWLIEELTRPEYTRGPSLLTRLWDWFTGLFGDVRGLGLPPWQSIAMAAVVIAAVVVVARFVAGPVRLAGGGRGPGALVAADDTRTAAELRAAADAAAKRGDWATAVAERFRAIVRSLEERAVLDARPGRTAQEAAADGGARLPAHAAALAAGATVFDGTVYGRRTPTAADDAALRALDEAVATARVTSAAT